MFIPKKWIVATPCNIQGGPRRPEKWRWFDVFNNLLQDTVACSGGPNAPPHYYLGFLKLKLSLSLSLASRREQYAAPRLHGGDQSPDEEHQCYICCTQRLQTNTYNTRGILYR